MSVGAPTFGLRQSNAETPGDVLTGRTLTPGLIAQKEIILRLSISPESAILTAICCVDMLLTLVLVQCRLATEQNPFMSACLSRGVLFFVVVKLLSFVPFVVLVEFHRRRNPRFVRTVTRCTILLYLGIYTTLFIKVNFPL